MATALSASVRSTRLDLDPLSKSLWRSFFTDLAACTSSKRASQSRRLPGVAWAYSGASRTGEGAYETLGLGLGASEQDIKKAYRRLALQYHPDVCKGEYCTAKFLQISDAYETVMDFVHGSAESIQDMAVETYSEGMMGVNDDSWEDWEEWMGWEGAGTRDYSSHINHAL